MSDLFDDGLSAEELAIGLGLAEKIAEEKKERLRLLHENESQPLVPDESQWYED